MKDLLPQLRIDYDIVEDENYLTSKDDIEDYFKDNGRDYIECGQGFFQDEAYLLVRIGEEFFDVTIFAECIGEWQEYGDKVYHVDRITDVTWTQVPTPTLKKRDTCMFVANLTEHEADDIERFLKGRKISYSITKN